MLPLNPTYLSQSTHSRNSLRLKHSLFFIFFIKTLLANLFLSLYCSFQPFISFFVCINNCSSTLVPLTDTHSHHNLTIHTLYPICTLRDRIQISWLFEYVHCNHNAKTDAETKAYHKHWTITLSTKTTNPMAPMLHFSTCDFASMKYMHKWLKELSFSSFHPPYVHQG